MKKYLAGFGIIALGAIAHLSIQAYVQTEVSAKIENKSSELLEASGQEVTHSFTDVRFDYFSFSTVVEDLQIQIGKPSIAIINIGKYEVLAGSNTSMLENVDMLVEQGIGGAISLMDVQSVVLDGDHEEKNEDWTYFKAQIDGLNVNRVFYENFLSPEMGDVAKLIVGDSGLSFSLSIENGETGQAVPASIGVAADDMFRSEISFKYHVGEAVVSGTSVDEKTGGAIEPQDGPRAHFVHSFSISVDDMGIRDTLFGYGAGFSDAPTPTDVHDFKNIIVSGLQTYVSEVVISPVLPFEAMNAVVEWVDNGGAFSTHVSFKEPVTINKLWTHLFGYPQLGIYDGAETSVGD